MFERRYNGEKVDILVSRASFECEFLHRDSTARKVHVIRITWDHLISDMQLTGRHNAPGTRLGTRAL